MHDYNKDQKVKDFIAAAEDQAKHYATNHIMMTMGSDFQYNNAQVWYKNLDKLIKYVNEKQTEGSRVNAFYSTPSCYLKVIKSESKETQDPYLHWTKFWAPTNLHILGQN